VSIWWIVERKSIGHGKNACIRTTRAMVMCEAEQSVPSGPAGFAALPVSVLEGSNDGSA
jgi:hypothetical protein